MNTIEKQTHIIIRKDNGQLRSLTMSGAEHAKHPTCSADHNTKIGDRVFWHDSTLYMNKQEGVVIELRQNDWDYSMPIRQRAKNVIESEGFHKALQHYHTQEENSHYKWF